MTDSVEYEWGLVRAGETELVHSRMGLTEAEARRWLALWNSAWQERKVPAAMPPPTFRLVRRPLSPWEPVPDQDDQQ